MESRLEAGADATVVVRDYGTMPSLIANGMSVRQERAEGYWMDIGRPPDYAQANADFGAVFET